MSDDSLDDLINKFAGMDEVFDADMEAALKFVDGLQADSPEEEAEIARLQAVLLILSESMGSAAEVAMGMGLLLADAGPGPKTVEMLAEMDPATALVITTVCALGERHLKELNDGE